MPDVVVVVNLHTGTIEWRSQLWQSYHLWHFALCRVAPSHRHYRDTPNVFKMESFRHYICRRIPYLNGNIKFRDYFSRFVECRFHPPAAFYPIALSVWIQIDHFKLRHQYIMSMTNLISDMPIRLPPVMWLPGLCAWLAEMSFFWVEQMNMDRYVE